MYGQKQLIFRVDVHVDFDVVFVYLGLEMFVDVVADDMQRGLCWDQDGIWQEVYEGLWWVDGVDCVRKDVGDVLQLQKPHIGVYQQLL